MVQVDALSKNSISRKLVGVQGKTVKPHRANSHSLTANVSATNPAI